MKIYIFIDLIRNGFVIINDRYDHIECEAILRIKKELKFQLVHDIAMNYEFESMYTVVRIINEYPKLFND